MPEAFCAAVLSTIAEGIGFAQMFQGGSATTAAIAFVFFACSMTALAVSLQRRINVLETEKTSLGRKRTIRGELERFLMAYKSHMDDGNVGAVQKLDDELRIYCTRAEELTGHFGQIVAGSHVNKATTPAHIKTPEQVNVWHRCQTRTYHLADLIKKFGD